MENQNQLEQTNQNALLIGKPYQTVEAFNSIIAASPKAEWVKVNPFSQNAKYLPIGVVENLLRLLYPMHQIEHVGDVKILGNSVVVSVTLKVYHPFYNQWLSYAGIGAVPIELTSGSNPIDFTKINAKAMHKNVPSALSFAVANAAKKIGNIFGANLNRELYKIN